MGEILKQKNMWKKYLPQLFMILVLNEVPTMSYSECKIDNFMTLCIS